MFVCIFLSVSCPTNLEHVSLVQRIVLFKSLLVSKILSRVGINLAFQQKHRAETVKSIVIPKVSYRIIISLSLLVI